MGERFCTILLLVLAAVRTRPYGVQAETEHINCDTEARDMDGESFTVVCPAGCATSGKRVWGTAIYTSDSGICRAAIHDGRIPATGGEVTVYKLPGQSSYQASDQHGVSSEEYGSWHRSFAFSQVVLIEGFGGSSIECPRPLVQRLNITSARYYGLTGPCESPGALQTLQALCGGQASCYVWAGDDVFGNSCPGQSRLDFSYECINLPEYYGCFGDGITRALSGSQWSPAYPDHLTIQACLKHCRTEGYKYAGVESEDECFCGDNEDFDKHGRASMDDCSDQCDGDDDQFCGGHWLIEIYESSMGQPCVDQTLDGSLHYVYSPDFPGLYPRSETCQWTISAQDDRVIKLYFDLFILASGDVITVRDGTQSSQDLAPAGGLTGATIPSVPASSGSAIWVRFQSDSRWNTVGRFIFWSQEIGHCGPIRLLPNSGAVAAPYTSGNVGVGETALVMCNNGRLVWVRCEENQQFNHTGPYCQDETTAISSTVSSTQTSQHSLTTQAKGFTTSLYPSNNAGQQGEGTGNTVTFIAVGVAVPLAVIVAVVVAIVLCRRKRNTTSKSPGSGQASQLDFTSSRASAPPSESVGMSSLGARYAANGGPDEHLYAVPDDDRVSKAAKPRRGDQNKNRSPAPPVNQNQDEGFTENDLYETADDVTAEGEGSVENILYGKVD